MPLTPDEAALTCIICGKRLRAAFPEHDEMGLIPQPYAGTWFTSHGQYGSTVFDDLHGNYLLVTICDECMKAKAEEGLILHRSPRRAAPPEPETTTWNPSSSC